MKASWTTGVSNKEIQSDIRKEYASSAILRERLVEILRQKQKASNKKNVIEASYDNPNWALKQADNVGFIRALEEVIGLLD